MGSRRHTEELRGANPAAKPEAQPAGSSRPPPNRPAWSVGPRCRPLERRPLRRDTICCQHDPEQWPEARNEERAGRCRESSRTEVRSASRKPPGRPVPAWLAGARTTICPRRGGPNDDQISAPAPGVSDTHKAAFRGFSGVFRAGAKVAETVVFAGFCGVLDNGFIASIRG